MPNSTDVPYSLDCKLCRKPFAPKTPGDKYCSPHCRHIWEREAVNRRYAVRKAWKLASVSGKKVENLT